MFNKETSQEHFIRILYDYMIGEARDLTMEEKELLVRQIVLLHKAYWRRCTKTEN